ncbi:MAG: T9SS type A sorting domain-containing protein [Bacteroidales bacterium]|nr:T9SS type A sorting domain-containing protein [Bacteroidales bacterium]
MRKNFKCAVFVAAFFMVAVLPLQVWALGQTVADAPAQEGYICVATIDFWDEEMVGLVNDPREQDVNLSALKYRTTPQEAITAASGGTGDRIGKAGGLGLGSGSAKGNTILTLGTNYAAKRIVVVGAGWDADELDLGINGDNYSFTWYKKGLESDITNASLYPIVKTFESETKTLTFTTPKNGDRAIIYRIYIYREDPDLPRVSEMNGRTYTSHSDKAEESYGAGYSNDNLEYLGFYANNTVGNINVSVVKGLEKQGVIVNTQEAGYAEQGRFLESEIENYGGYIALYLQTNGTVAAGEYRDTIVFKQGNGLTVGKFIVSLKVRAAEKPDDPVKPITVANLRALRDSAAKYNYSDEQLYNLTGEVVVSAMGQGPRYWVQDAGAGVLIKDVNWKLDPYTYSAGEGIKGITGKIGRADGLLQFIPTDTIGAANSTGNTIDTIVLTRTEYFNNIDKYESRLIRINGLSLEDSVTFEDGELYNFFEGSASVKIYAGIYTADYIDDTIPSGRYDIVGIAGRINNDLTIMPRSLSDMIATRESAFYVSENEVAFGETELNSEVSNTDITVTAYDCVDGLTLEITGDNAEFFKASLASLTEGGILTVTYEPTEVGIHNATLTISYGALEEIIALSGTGAMPAPVATAASDTTATSFIANWDAVSGAEEYELRVYYGAEVLSEDFASVTTGDNTTSNGSNAAWSGNANFTTSGFVASAGGAIKLASGGNSGTITTKAMDLSSGKIKVSLDVKGWENSSRKITVKVDNGVAQTIDVAAGPYQTGSFETKTVIFPAATASSKIIISAAEDNRIFVDNILITVDKNILEENAGNVTSYEVTDLRAKTEYLYTVKATGNGVSSAASNEISVTTLAEPSIYVDCDELLTITSASQDIPESAKILITGELLSHHVIATLSGDDVEHFEISADTHYLEQVMGEGSVLTVTYKGSKHNANAVITLRSGAVVKTINVKGLVDAGPPVAVSDNVVAAGLRVYPNPAVSAFNVKVALPSVVTIFNAAGVKLRELNVNETAAVNSLGSGMYLLRAVDANGKVSTQRVIVK